MSAPYPRARIRDLTDVDSATALTDGFALTYDQASGKFKGKKAGATREFSPDDYGAVGDGVADDGPALRSAWAAACAIAQAGGRGVVMLTPARTYKQASVGADGLSLAVPANLPASGSLEIDGRGATLLMSAACSRVVDCPYNADYETFRNVTIRRLRIDHGLAVPAVVSHIIFGHFGTVMVDGVASAGQGYRQNFDNITIEDVETFNVKDVNTGTSKNIWISPVALTPADTTSITRIRVRRVRMLGGRGGILIAGSTDPSFVGFGTPNSVFDDILVEDCYYDGAPGASVTLNSASSGVQIGGPAPGGRATVRRCFAKNSGDVGFEMDSCQTMLVEDCHAEDCWNVGFTVNNYTNPSDPEAQRFVFVDCSYKRVNRAGGRGFGTGGGGDGTVSAAPVTNLYYIRCKALWKCPTAPGGSQGGFVMLSHPAKLVLEDCRDVYRAFSHDVAGTKQCQSILVQPGSNPLTQTCQLRVRSHHVRWTGNRGAVAGTLGFIGAQVQGVTCVTDVDGFDFDCSATGTALNGGSLIGVKLVSTAISGAIRRLRMLQTAGDAAPQGVNIATSTGLSIPTTVTIDDCDFSAMPGGTEVSVGDTTNKLKVFAGRFNRYRVADAAANITVSASPFVYQNVTTRPRTTLVRGGTVSKVEVSVDAGVTWDDTGETAGAFVLAHGNQMRVTYSVAPTMRDVPVVL